METYLYDALYRHEKSYWWSVSRRDMVIDLWKSVRHRETENVSILDVGCGTGAMLDILSGFGEAYGADNSEVAVRYCRNRMIGKTVVADMAGLPFGDGEFDLITALDVVEHVDDDVAALRELRRVCSHDGLLLLTVPAFNFLWSSRDIRLGHKRRYDVAEIVRKMETAGFHIDKASYTNLSYFIPLYLVVRIKSLLKGDIKTDIAEVPSVLNRLLTGILALETILLRRMDFPFGVSIVCMARKSPNVSLDN
jgi:SAM-dependent methyltransferase